MNDRSADDTWPPDDILAHASLVPEGVGTRGDGAAEDLALAGITLARPHVYRVLPTELSLPYRRRAEDGGVQYVGLICAAELDELPRGRAYTALCLTVTLPDAAYRAVGLRADQQAMELVDGLGEAKTLPAPAAVGRLSTHRPSRLARLGQSIAVLGGAAEERPGCADTRESGMYRDEFSWTFAAPGGGQLAERTFVRHALVEAPVAVTELAGRLAGRVTVRRSSGRFVRSVTAVMREGTPFSERINGLRTAPAGGRAVRLVVSIDLERYSRHDIGGSERTQNRLAQVLDRALAGTGVTVEDRQVGGDSAMLVFPAGIDEGAVLERFYRDLTAAVRTVNLDLGEHAVLRLRVAVDRGQTQRAGTGWTGQVPIAVARLRDGKPAREALAAAPSAPLVLTVSDVIYRDVFSERGREPGPERFRQVEVDIPEKQYTATAWVHVP